MIHHSAYIHPNAHVDRETCHVGAGTKIYQLASVTRWTRLGEDCVVWPFAMLDGPVIGDRCKIASGVVMGPGFKIGDDVFIGPNVTLCNDMWPEANQEGFDDTQLRFGRWAVEIENGASIGAGAVIMPGVIIRSGALIAAGAVVERSVPENMVYRRDGYMAQIPANRRDRRMVFTGPAS